MSGRQHLFLDVNELKTDEHGNKIYVMQRRLLKKGDTDYPLAVRETLEHSYGFKTTLRLKPKMR